jgi:hypothetical protein
VRPLGEADGRIWKTTIAALMRHRSAEFDWVVAAVASAAGAGDRRPGRT